MGNILKRYIISNDKITLESIDKKINDLMKSNIENYNAKSWGKIIIHPNENKFALEINEDNRNPIEKLSSNEKTKLVTKLSDDWYDEDKEKFKFLIYESYANEV